MSWWSVSSFSFQAEYTGAFSVPTANSLKDWGGINVGAVPRKLSVYGYTLIYMNFSPCCGAGNSWSLSKHCRCTLCIRELHHYAPISQALITSMLLVNSKVELTFHKLMHLNDRRSIHLTSELHGAGEAYSSSDQDEIPHISSNPKVHYRLWLILQCIKLNMA